MCYNRLKVSTEKNLRTFAGLPPREAVFFGVVGLLILLLYPLLWPQAPFLSGDSLSYMRVAEDLSDFRLDGLHIRTPGYPLLLLLTGSTKAPTRLLFFVSLGLHFASIWIIGAVLHHLRFPAWCLRLFAVLMSLPPFMEAAAVVLSEILAEFAIVCSFGLLVLWLSRRKVGWLIAAGLSLGWSALVRPTFQFTSVVIALTFLLLSMLATHYMTRREAIAGSLVVFLTSTALIVSFASYNYVKHRIFNISPSMMQVSLATRTVSVLERIPDEYGVEREIMIAARNRDLIRRGSSHQGDQYYFSIESDLMAATGLQRAEFERRIMKIYVLLILNAPMTYLMEVLHSCTTFWFPWAYKLSGSGTSLVRLFWSGLSGAWIGFFLVQVVVLTGASLLALLRWLRTSRQTFRFNHMGIPDRDIAIYLIGIAIIFYTMVISCTLNIGEGRYRAPLDPILICLSFIGARICLQLTEPQPGMVTESGLRMNKKASER